MSHRDAAKAALAHMAAQDGGGHLALAAPAFVSPGLHRQGTHRLAEWLLSLTARADYEEVRIYAVPSGCIPTEASTTGLALGVEQGVTVLASRDSLTAATGPAAQPAGRYTAKVVKREGAGVRFDPLQGTGVDDRWERLLCDMENASGWRWSGTGYASTPAGRRVLFVVDLAWLRSDGNVGRTATPLLTLRQRWMEFLRQRRSADLVWITNGAPDELRRLLQPPRPEEPPHGRSAWSAASDGILQSATRVTMEDETAPWFPTRGQLSVADMLRTIPPQMPAKRVDSEVIRTIGAYRIERLAGSLEDVAGYDEVKRSIRSMSERWANPELARSYGLSGNMGMLLFGPGGTGKTTIARAAAAELGLPFMEVKCSDFATKYINESASNLSAAFDAARSEPAIMLFFDEVDSILGQRDNASGEDAKVINEFKAQLGKPFPNWRVLLVGATNNPWTMEAPVRQRFGEQLFIDLPDAQARAFLFRIKTTPDRLAPSVSFAHLADRTEGFSGREIAAICQKAGAAAFAERTLIDAEMFERAIATTKRTVTAREMQQHRAFANGAS